MEFIVLLVIAGIFAILADSKNEKVSRGGALGLLISIVVLIVNLVIGVYNSNETSPRYKASIEAEKRLNLALKQNCKAPKTIDAKVACFLNKF